MSLHPPADGGSQDVGWVEARVRPEGMLLSILYEGQTKPTSVVLVLHTSSIFHQISDSHSIFSAPVK